MKIRQLAFSHLNTRQLNMRFWVTGILALTLLPGVVFAFGDNCKDVRMAVFNDHPVEIKVLRIEYKDYDKDGKWRTENVTNRKIATTKHYTFIRNLEYVKNDDTKIKVVYKENLGGTRWSSERTVSGAKHACSTGEYNRIHLPGPSVYDQP